MPRYKTTVRAYVGSELLGENVEFSSDAVPGRTWRPICKDAKAAVRARDEAAKAASSPKPAEPDPRVAELEALVEAYESDAVKAAERIAELEAQVALFDGDKDGKIGGSAPKS